MRVGFVYGNEPACAAFGPVARQDLRAASVGYLFPRVPFDATVHSVYRSACNLLHGDALLTLGAFALPDGPSTVRLGGHASIDLRDWFSAGEGVTRRGASLASRHVQIDLGRARTWARPQPPLLPSTPRDLTPSLHAARTRLALRRAQCTSVLDREGVSACTALEHACRSLDARAADQQIARLIGWGEGLTPAGDDFVVGLLAALQMLARDDARRSFLEHLCATIATVAASTTALAAHALRLAARDHFNADVHAVRQGLLDGSDAAGLERALDTLLSRGATSGGDMLAGLLAGLVAWAPSRTTPATRAS